MDTSITAERADDTRARPARVTLRYWAAARAAAGRAEEQFVGATVAAILEEARLAHLDSPRFAQVLGVSSLLLGDRPIGALDPGAVTVVDGDVIEVLPPFAGG